MLKVIGLGDQVVDKYEHLRIMYPGGNALNFAAFAEKLGAQAAFLGAFGNDAEGDHVRSTIEAMKIDNSHSRVYEGENGCARVSLVDGDRVFLGSNRCGVLRTIGTMLKEEDYQYLEGFDLIHSALYGFSENDLKIMKKRGSQISYDFSDDFTQEQLEDMLPYVDFAFFSGSHLSHEELQALLEKACAAGCQIALVTRGSEGAYLYNGKQVYRQLPNLVKATDTMAAGDSFLTCFLVRYLTALSDGQEEDTAIRNALSAAAQFSSEQCLIDGSFGHGKAY